MRERKCSFQGEAPGRVRGLNPKKAVCGMSFRLSSADVAKKGDDFCTFFERESSGSEEKKKKEIVPLPVPVTLVTEIGKKKSCQELKVSRPLDAAETRLYGWVEEAVLTQPSVVQSDLLLEFRRNFPLMEDSGTEGDYVLEAAGPSDRVPFRAGKGDPHFLWRDVMTRCRVAVSQLHLNEWGFILAFEKVCLHYGFRPTIRLFFYIYDIHFPRVVMGTSSSGHAKALDHENKPFSWVYWNPGAKDFTVYNLEPLEMASFKFLVSLPGGLPKRNMFTCRWILDGFDAEVGKFLDDLLEVKMKKTKLDNLMAMMEDSSRMGPWAVLLTGRPFATATAAAAAAASASAAAAGPTPVESSSQVPPVLTASKTHRTKKQSSKRDRSKVVNLEGEEGLREDPAADL
ncbi:hypothetical protein PIB30_030929 [Stylosanthes scabra]|uniref:Uncharacterized protein n=1 Tax=Stylosanthes scabra TaxID=79078 RepID=A0ABU6QD20_9FABA|nr:hypothetical protein [Stylosanthes scabra]